MKNILICSPPMYMGAIFLPYVHSQLKLVAEQNPILKENYNWLDPLYLPIMNLNTFTQQYDPKEIDILGISCYNWNYVINTQIAEYVKSVNPDCLVVGGGPDLSWIDSTIFEEHPYIDIIAKGDGEELFSELLLVHHSLHSKSNSIITDTTYSSVDSLIINENLEAKHTGSQRKFKFDPSFPSAYEVYSDEMASYVQAIYDIGQTPWGILETNKGCPYKCTFCDWGSSTNQKMTMAGADKIKADIAWLGENHVHSWYITDANFGILAADYDITTKYIIESKHKHGYPQSISVNIAKNSNQRIVDILVDLNNNGMLDYCPYINFQSTNDQVLNAIERFNSDFDTTKALIEGLIYGGVLPASALIVGCPGETSISWRESVTDVFELGIHHELRLYPWQQFPNAPSKEPDYIKKHKIESVFRIPRVSHFSKTHLDFVDRIGKTEYLVSTATFTREEYTDMIIFGSFAVACHNLGPTQYISKYLRHTHNISYHDFYVSLYEKFKISFPEMYSKILKHYLSFTCAPELDFNTVLWAMDYVEECPLLLEPQSWLFLSILPDIDEFYKMIDYDVPHLNECIAFQKRMLVMPMIPPVFSETYTHDWLTYFNDLDKSNYNLREYPVNQETIRVSYNGEDYETLYSETEPNEHLTKYIGICGLLGKHGFSLLTLKQLTVTTNEFGTVKGTGLIGKLPGEGGFGRIKSPEEIRRAENFQLRAERQMGQ